MFMRDYQSVQIENTHCYYQTSNPVLVPRPPVAPQEIIAESFYIDIIATYCIQNIDLITELYDFSTFNSKLVII